MRIMVIDDDAASLAATKNILSQFPQIEKVDTVSTMDAFCAVLQQNPPDAVLVDVEMEEVSGFEVAQYLQRQYPTVPYVFLTGHAQWALKGYDYSPLDFLTKPLSLYRLEKTLQKIQNRRFGGGTEAKKEKPQDKKICLPVNHGYEIISVADISYMERIQRKVYIHRENGSVVVSNDTLKNLADIFSDRPLFRCNRSFLVPLDRIESIRVEENGRVYYLKLKGCPDDIPLSRKIYPELKKAMEENSFFF